MVSNKVSSESPIGDLFPALEIEDNEEMEGTTQPVPLKLNTLNYDTIERERVYTLCVYIKEIKKTSIKVTFKEKFFCLKFTTSDAKFLSVVRGTEDTLFTLSCNLPGVIEPSRSYHKLSKVKIELLMYKKDFKPWPSLVESCVNVATSQPQTSTNWEPVVNKSKPTCKVIPYRQIEPVADAGFTGLNNIGNTCFMNSVLQCLSNTKELRDYFLESRYLDDINAVNPLGMKGQLAKAFGGLMTDLWSRQHSSVCPTKLKYLLAKKATQFSGFAQHDAQEVLAFLLDGLHEDLNRIINPPLTGTIESDGREDRIVAEESWATYKRRNDSIIVDLFQGQYRSTLVCPVCTKVSVTFDPFLFLSTPLPKKKTVYTIYFFWRHPSRKPRKLRLLLPMDSKAVALYEAVSASTNVNKHNIRLWKAEEGRWKRFYEINSGNTPPYTLYAYEVLDGQGVIEIPVIQRLLMAQVPEACSFCNNTKSNTGDAPKRCTKCFRVAYCNRLCQKKDWGKHKLFCFNVPQAVGVPFLISLKSSKLTYSVLSSIMDRVAKHSVDAFRPPLEKSFTDNIEKNYEGEEFMFKIKPVSLIPGKEMDSSYYIDTDLDLKDVECLAMDWMNDEREEKYVMVQGKSLDIEEDVSPPHTPQEPSLHNCLQLLTEPEVLSAQEAWYCPRCKFHREAKKQMRLWKLPTIMIIQLKRFSFKSILFKDKIDSLISFPVRDLDVSSFVCENSEESRSKMIYDLYAVVNHYGGILGGHYTSYCRTIDCSNIRRSEIDWRLFDDSKVSPADERSVPSKQAYLLFYRRRGVPFNQPTQSHL